MDNGSGKSRPIDGCEVRVHGSCSACGAPIFRRKLHAHIYGRKVKAEETLCEECYSLILVAAERVLRSLNNLGMNPSAEGLTKMLGAGLLSVLVQARLP